MDQCFATGKMVVQPEPKIRDGDDYCVCSHTPKAALTVWLSNLWGRTGISECIPKVQSPREWYPKPVISIWTIREHRIFSAMASDGYLVSDDRDSVILQVHCLTGEGFTLKLCPRMQGQEQHRIQSSSRCQAIYKAWLWAACSMRLWRDSLCRAVCKAWLWVRTSTRAWREWCCPTVSKTWI